MERVLVSRGTEKPTKLHHGEWLEICAPCAGTDSAAEAVLRFSRFSEVVLAPESSLDVLATRGALLADDEDGDDETSSEGSAAGDMQVSATLSTASGTFEVPIAACPLCTLSPMAPG
eukprot:SRR837773.26519.p1 GENE.SRR837773.26519~~SRR837773.26519.p1  ORF type:complete len:130 (+),score=42.10 SRR837773.26519:42-392(+)